MNFSATLALNLDLLLELLLCLLFCLISSPFFDNKKIITSELLVSVCNLAAFETVGGLIFNGFCRTGGTFLIQKTNLTSCNYTAVSA